MRCKVEKNQGWKQLWLKYDKKTENGNGRFFQCVRTEGFDLCCRIVKSALEELKRGVAGMLGVDVNVVAAEDVADAKTAGFVLRKVGAENAEGIKEQGYALKEEGGVLTVAAADANGLLYGVFHVLRLISMGKKLEGVNALCNPDNPLRMFNHWDNMDGSIERGYSGNSFFFVNNEIVIDDRTRDYARLMSSIGINGVVINNVNVKQAATWLITDRYFEKVAQMAEIFADYGIKFFMSLNYAATIELGGLDSADPLEPKVIAWWKEKMKECFEKIPTLGGFLVKADSEGRPGPFTYGRTQADGANMLADIVKPYGGIIIWRCFVYNCQQDWRDYKTDRARAGYDNFIKMDGDYHDNVILQIKNGPMDFQIREPISPLLGGLQKTNQMLEVQVAQEYTGHQIDVCYLIPMFKEVLDFHTYCKPGVDTVADVISGRTMGNKNTGIAAVINTGNDANWTGNYLAAANLYGFGRLAFKTSLTAEEILDEWIPMSFSADAEVITAIKSILLPSRATYEKYTSPLGIGWMVTPHNHYGCSVDGYEYDRWGTYHRADHLGIGVDRSENGTGYALQYYEPNASMYNKMETCPEELILFFHHVPYTYVLKTGKTVIQHIYDTHFEGYDEAEGFAKTWEGLEGKVDAEVFANVKERFGRQLYNAREWRDQVNSYFFRKSGIADEKGRKIY
ncbi:MAG: alpha-glucuronidase [Lachnospiraceae bacterium]|nr:alpha-glucuronidase [Lachnospiraceae bacterium]